MGMSATRRLKHWGWGYEDQQPSRDQVEGIARAVTDRLGFEVDEIEEPVPLDAVELPEPRITPPKPFAEMFSSDRYDRVAHSLGKAYRDVVRGFRGEFADPPDLVAYPESAEDVDIVLNYCADEGAAAIPFGGGTTVVGGVEPRMRDEYPGVVSIDLTRMDRVLEVDAVSKSARIQAGATGPRLEEQLREHGLTLRHFPQSFEYSTLGGWIATRAGGHFATLETHIDDLVESVRAVTLGGAWESRRLPGSGAGPSPDRMLLGSEGTLGVITEAWVRVRSRPEHRAGRTVRFATFEDGAEAVRAIVQSGLRPANVRLIEADEARFTMAGDGSAHLLVLGFESPALAVDEQLDAALGFCGAGAVDPPKAQSSGAWRSAFLRAPYVRDTFVAVGVLSETFETAITWERFGALREAAVAAAG